MHGAPVRPTFDQTIGADFVAADGQTVECMTEDLGLYTTKIFHNGLSIGGSKQMLSGQSPKLDFFQCHLRSPLPIILVDSIIARGTGKAKGTFAIPVKPMVDY